MIGKTQTKDVQSLLNILDATPASVQIVGSDGMYLDCNAATYAMFRASSGEEIIGKPPSIFSHEKQGDGTDSAEGSMKYINMALAGETVSFEWYHQRLDGEIFPCKVTLQVIDYEGQKCLMATIVDITELVSLRKKSDFIISNAPTPIMDLRPDFSIQASNLAFDRLIDKTVAEISLMKVTDFDIRNRVGGSLAEGLETKSQVNGELDAVVPSGEKHLQYCYTPFYDDDGSLNSIIAYYIDKTTEKTAVRDILTLTEKCQAGNLDARLDSTSSSPFVYSR